ncbi:glycosyltransferase family 9 protein [Prosthecobacter vanneervenii]|uniref:ADP-heptose:LPS heptosyltransferase n=1 Tax=Prosthecobacter vanneervenii TaxID=48466 RepID=A0A7W7YGE5_9BACT|nr:glycosyltransferase family 9 protein [Prosthecobacter vanneervenii]MBB5035683.1 ADP-heptose:LPS heptosyltransferase [Prosthecobacter vanneervenii]
MPTQPRILVIRGGAIGDFILTLPVLRLLRDMIADSHIEVLGYPAIAELARSAGLADSIRSLEHRTMAPLFAKTAPIDDALAEHLRSFNLVVSFLYDPDGLFRASMERIGVKTLIECSPIVQPGGPHASRQLARGLEKIAMFLEDVHLLRAHFEPRPHSQPRIAIHVGSGSEKKNWPLDRWQQVAESLGTQEVIFITGEAEAERGTQPTGRDCWHALPLPELATRLATCTAFLGHDSGISHLAAACGVPSLLLFGPTDPAIWAPPQPWVRVLRNSTQDLTFLSVEQVKLAAAQVVANS